MCFFIYNLYFILYHLSIYKCNRVVGQLSLCLGVFFHLYFILYHPGKCNRVVGQLSSSSRWLGCARSKACICIVGSSADQEQVFGGGGSGDLDEEDEDDPEMEN